MKTIIQATMEIEKCNECPFHDTRRTPGAGYAIDYFCVLEKGKEIAGYIEWNSDLPYVPDWCPIAIERRLSHKGQVGQ